MEAMLTMRAPMIDVLAWLQDRRKWGDEHRGLGRTKEVKRTVQREREAQGRAAQPVVSAEALAD